MNTQIQIFPMIVFSLDPFVDTASKYLPDITLVIYVYGCGKEYLKMSGEMGEEIPTLLFL